MLGDKVVCTVRLSTPIHTVLDTQVVLNATLASALTLGISVMGDI